MERNENELSAMNGQTGGTHKERIASTIGISTVKQCLAIPFCAHSFCGTILIYPYCGMYSLRISKMFRNGITLIWHGVRFRYCKEDTDS